MGWKSVDTMATSLGLFLFIFLVLGQAKAENKTCPTRNQNLSPIQAWRSAEYCMQNTSNSCPKQYTLNDSGWLNVTNEDGPSFCSSGCAEHTKWVLYCIEHVKRDYWFANRANIQDLNDTINIGCNSSQGFNGTSLYGSDGYKLNSVSHIFTAISATAFLLFALF